MNIDTTARYAEIIASLGVIVSLIFVAYSVNQNTRALQSANDNFLYETQMQRISDVTTDGDLASILSRYESGEELSTTEMLRYRLYKMGTLNMWESAYNRHRAGLLADEQWHAWNDMWEQDIPNQFPDHWWAEGRYQFGAEFAKHVDAAYERHK